MADLPGGPLWFAGSLIIRGWPQIGCRFSGLGAAQVRFAKPDAVLTDRIDQVNHKFSGFSAACAHLGIDHLIRDS